MPGCCGAFWVERMDVSHLRLQDQNVRVVCSAQLDPVDLERMLAGGVASRCGTEALRLFLEAMFQDPRSRVRAQTCRVATAAAFEYRTPAPDGDGWPGQSAARRAVEGCFPAVLGMCGSGAGPAALQGRECLSTLAWGEGGDVRGGRGRRIGSLVPHTAALRAAVCV